MTQPCIDAAELVKWFEDRGLMKVTDERCAKIMAEEIKYFADRKANAGRGSLFGEVFGHPFR